MEKLRFFLSGLLCVARQLLYLLFPSGGSVPWPRKVSAAIDMGRYKPVS